VCTVNVIMNRITRKQVTQLTFRATVIAGTMVVFITYSLKVCEICAKV